MYYTHLNSRWIAAALSCLLLTTNSAVAAKELTFGTGLLGAESYFQTLNYHTQNLAAAGAIAGRFPGKDKFNGTALFGSQAYLQVLYTPMPNLEDLETIELPVIAAPVTPDANKRKRDRDDTIFD